MLVGRGGSGKSTVLRVAAAMVGPRDVCEVVSADAVRVTAGAARRWASPTIAAANEFAGDAAGLELFPFDSVPAADAVLTSLGDRIIAEELPAVVARCVRAYLRCIDASVHRLAGACIWMHLDAFDG